MNYDAYEIKREMSLGVEANWKFWLMERKEELVEKIQLLVKSLLLVKKEQKLRPIAAMSNKKLIDSQADNVVNELKLIKELEDEKKVNLS